MYEINNSTDSSGHTAYQNTDIKRGVRSYHKCRNSGDNMYQNTNIKKGVVGIPHIRILKLPDLYLAFHV